MPDPASDVFHAFAVRIGMEGFPKTDQTLAFVGQRLATFSRMEAVRNGPGWIDEDPPTWEFPSRALTLSRDDFPGLYAAVAKSYGGAPFNPFVLPDLRDVSGMTPRADSAAWATSHVMMQGPRGLFGEDDVWSGRLA